MATIAGVVLAAGSSVRLGQPKQLLPIDGQPLLQLVLNTVRQTDLNPLFVVLGHAHQRIQKEVDLSRYTVLLNPDFASGQSTSVRTAVDRIGNVTAAAMFILGDQPELDPMVIERLLSVYHETGAPIVQPRYSEGPGHPVLIDRSLFPELLDLQGDIGARPVIQRHRELVHRVDLTGFSRPDDIDTWEDYQRVSARIIKRLRSAYEL